MTPQLLSVVYVRHNSGKKSLFTTENAIKKHRQFKYVEISNTILKAFIAVVNLQIHLHSGANLTINHQRKMKIQHENKTLKNGKVVIIDGVKH